MKKRIRFLSILASILLLGVSSFAIFSKPQVKEADAASDITYFTGKGGEIMYVSGGCFSDSTPLAVYFYNGSTNAWSSKITHKLYSSVFLVNVPGSSSTTWSHLIVCKYDAAKEPSTHGFDGRLSQTGNIPISDVILYGRNCVNITGDSEGTLSYGTSTKVSQYGVQSDTHLYLDLTELPEWDSEYAKMAIYFAYPNHYSGEGWSQQFSSDHSSLESSFCWKVEGQTNPYLYECIIPKCNGIKVLWSMVIGVRLEASAPTPAFDYAWNQTQDLNFNSSNHESNIIRVTKNGDNWTGGGYLLDSEYSIGDNKRANFYGQYFLDTVKCSGSGNSDVTTSAMWSSVESEYKRHLSTDVEGVVWLAEADEEGSTIEQAMARYDYILFYKNYSHNDFVNRNKSGESGFISSLTTSNNNLILIISIVSITSLSILPSLYSRKRRRFK